MNSQSFKSFLAIHMYWIVAIMTWILFATGVYLSNSQGLAACPLCIVQRIIFLKIAVWASVAWLFQRCFYRWFDVLLCQLIALTALFGAFVAGYQSWMQRFGTETSCGAASWWENIIYQLGELFPTLFYASGLCQDPGLTILGLSLSEYAFFFFILIVISTQCRFFYLYKKIRLDAFHA